MGFRRIAGIFRCGDRASGVNTRQWDLASRGLPLHVDCVHPFPTVNYSSISGGDLVILSERALWSDDISSARPAGGGRETANDSWGGQQEQNVTVKDG